MVDGDTPSVQRLRVLFETAVETQAAGDEAAVLAAVAEGLTRVGFSCHMDLLAPDGRLLVRHAALVPREAQEVVEARLGRSIAGIELDGSVMPYAAVRRGEVVWVESARAWLETALPWLDARMLRVFGRLTGVGQGVCAPIAGGQEVLGAMSVWGPVVSQEDLPTIALLGRYAGAALTALRLRRDAVERARLDGALLAARTATHVLNNRLMLTVGFTELLAESADLPASLRGWALEAKRGALETAEALRQLERVVRLEEIQHGATVGNTIDLERSTGTTGATGSQTRQEGVP